MGCSNGRLLVRGPSAIETGARTNNPVPSSATEGTSPANVSTDTTSTRMHLTGVDLVVERNGSYTLLLTPKTHKQLMPYVLRKKRFRILVDKPRSEPILNSNEPNMENNKELKLNTEKDNKSKQIEMNESTIESLEQVASDELNKAKTRLIGGRSIDHGNRDYEDENVQSDDEGMIEEIVTTVEQDKDLECKVKKKIETKKTTSQHPDTHNTITKVVKTEVTEITRTITINDHHDLERAKRELGIDDVNKLLPSSKWTHQSNIPELKQKQNESVKETVTSKDTSSDNQVKQIQSEKKHILSESTTVGRGPVTDTISSLSSPKSEQKLKTTKKKKKSKFCSCTRSTAAADEQDQEQTIISSIEQKPAVLPATTQVVKSAIDTQIQGQQLISSDLKQLIIDKKILLIEYMHTKIFSPSKLFPSNEKDVKVRKISSRILDLLRYDRCSSWTQMLEQLTEEYKNYLSNDFLIQPMVSTYESLFTTKQANLLNTFATIHHENDIDNIQENSDYVTIVEKHIHERDDQPNVGIIVKQSADNRIDKVEQLKHTTEDRSVDKLEKAPAGIQTENPEQTSEETLVEKIEQIIEEIQSQKLEQVIDEAQSENLEQVTEEAQAENLEEIVEEAQTEKLEQVIGETDVDKLEKTIEEEPVEKVINDDEHVNKEVNMTAEIQEAFSIYNEQQLIKVLADVSQHKPITLAEAIAYQYIDIEDPKLGLSNDVIQHIKHLFRPLSDQTVSNLIRVQRSGEYLTDINLAETNPFEKLNLTEPYIYQLQPSFEPTLDFSEKQFRLLTEAILNNKEQYDQLQFNIARTSLPICDVKDSSINDFSQSDSGYSMTTVTHDSLASKIKIEFEPINQQMPVPPPRSDLHENEKIDLDKATLEQLNRYELNHDLIQIIKSDYHVSDKTIGQAILSRELRLDSTDPNDLSRLNTLGIHEEHARILHAFFFPKQTRTIAYSPEPGRFVEAQTTYNPDYPGYKTDTTIIQIQDKQLSSDHLAKKRNIHDDRTLLITSEPKQNSDVVIRVPLLEPTSTAVTKETISLTPTSTAAPATTTTTTTTATAPSPPASLKKRKSSGHGSLLTCFRSKKPKAGTEQQGQPTIQPTVVVNEAAISQQTTTNTEEKLIMDYAIGADGKRIYIDTFRDRPGLDMSYKPNDFENRFILPISKPVTEYEEQIIAEIEPITSTIEPITLESKSVEHVPIVQLEPRSPVVERVDVQSETIPIVIHSTKTDEMTVKKKLNIDLHGAAVKLPEIELVKPGPLPTLSIGKEKKVKKVKTESTGGLCASCFGKKSKQNKKQKEILSETVQAPIKQKKAVEPETKEDLSLTSILATKVNESSSTPSTTANESSLPKVNIDVFRERTFEKHSENLPEVKKRLDVTSEKVALHVEPHDQASSNEPVPLASSSSKPLAIQDTSIFYKVNIDTFRERTFQKASENLPKSEEHRDAIIQSMASRSEEPHYELPTNEPIQPPKEIVKPIASTTKDTSIFSQVNIDTFRERSFEKGSENHPKPADNTNATYVTVVSSHEESHQQLPADEPVQTSTATIKTITSAIKDASIFSQVNIDTFRERTFEKGSEMILKPTERTDAADAKVTASHQESHYESPTNEPVQSPVGTVKTITVAAKDSSIFSQVNIDTFRERTLEKGSETNSKPVQHIEATNLVGAAPCEEAHYELPKNEPLSNRTAVESIAKDTSIFSKVNIDTFRERTFEKSPKNSSKIELPSDITIGTVVSSEEPHYQLPSSEPVPLSSIPLENEYSTVDRNTYDVPRISELQQTESSVEIKTNVKTINNVPIMSSAVEVQKSSGNILTNRTIQETVKIDEISSITTDISTNVHGKETKVKNSSKISKKTKKPKAKKSKTDDKCGLFSTLFCHNKQKSKVPAHVLPSLERDLTTHVQLNPLHCSDDDPLHIPSTDLPKLDIPLPTYNRPEVDMTAGQIKQTSEFNIPALNLTAIPNLQLPEHNKQLTDSKSDQMKIPNVQLPDIQFTSNEQINEKPAIILTVENPSSTKTVSVAKTELIIPNASFDGTEVSIKPELSSTEQLTTKIENNSDQTFNVTVLTEHKKNIDLQSQIPSSEHTSTLTSTSIPVTILHDVSTQKSSDKELIATKSKPTKKTSTLSLCSCFSNKSHVSKTKASTLEAPKTNLPKVNLPISSTNLSSTLKTKGSLHAPVNDLPPIDLTPKSIEPISLSTMHSHDKKSTLNEAKTSAPLFDIKKNEEIQVQTPIQSLSVEKHAEDDPKIQVDVSKTIIETQQLKDNQIVSVEPKKSPLFEIKAPAISIPELNLSGPSKTDAYLSFTKHEESTPISDPIQSRSDSGLEAIVSSHIHPSSTFGTAATMDDIRQLPSISSGLGSEISDKITIKSTTVSDIQILKPTVESKEELKYDLTHTITINDELRSKLKSRQDQLKTCLESEISTAIIDYDPKKDHKPLDKILTHAIDLIKDKKVSTYSELQHKLIVEHKHDAFIVDPVIHSLYYTIEKHGLDNLDKPEFPLAIRDMVRLPDKQTYDTVTHLNKEATPLATTQMTNETQSLVSAAAAAAAAAQHTTTITIEPKSSEQTTKPIDDKAHSCLACGRSKSKAKLSSSPSATATSSSGLLDERHRTQLNAHRNELGTVVNNHIQSSQPSIRNFAEHPREVEKITRKTLTLVTQPKIHSYEQIRNDLKTEYKQTFYLVDPTIDIIRDTLNHCDITQMNEKINLDILNSNISQTANLYNSQTSILTNEEYNALKSNQLSWLQQHLITNEIKEKKLTRKQNKELSKILHRTLEILSTNHISTWDELTLQLQREFPKAHDLCTRSVELVRQSQKNGLFLLQQAPNIEEKRRSSFLITDRARQNLKANRNQVFSSLKSLLINHNNLSNDDNELDIYLNKTLHYLEEQKQGQFKTYDDLKQQLKQDFKNNKQENLIDQIVDVMEQAHATNQFEDIDKPEVQALMKDRLNGKPLIIKEMYVSLPPRIGALKSSNEESLHYLSTSANGDRTFNSTISSHAVARGLSWREANERARILFYRGKHPAIHYDEKAAAFDVRMLLETASGGTQEIPVTDSDVHELLNSCGVQWDGVNIISLVDHSEDVVRAAEQAALKVIREKGIIDLRAPPSTNNVGIHDDDLDGSVVSPDAPNSSS